METHSHTKSAKETTLLENTFAEALKVELLFETPPPSLPHLETQGILERLNAGEVVIGDGGFVFALEKRGYVKAGPWTPEAAVEHPEAGWCILRSKL